MIARHIILMALIILSSSIRAQSLTLEEVLEKSLAKNNGVHLAEQNHAETLAESLAIETRENPEISAQLSQNTTENNTGITLEISQPLKRSHWSGARTAYAKALTEAADIQKRHEIFQVVLETTSIYIQVWQKQEQKKRYESYANEAKKIKVLIQKASLQGQASQAALALFSTDELKFKTDAHKIGAQLQQIHHTLSRLIGHHTASNQLIQPSFSFIPNDRQKMLIFAESKANLRQLIQTQKQVTKARLRTAQEDASFPEIAPRIEYARDSDGQGSYYGIGFSLKVPLWDQNNAERKRVYAAESYYQKAQDLEESWPLSERIATLADSAERLQKSAASYQKEIMKGYRQAYELTRQMFLQGQTDALSVWQVREKLLLSENEALETIVEALQAELALEEELGGQLEEIQ